MSPPPPAPYINHTATIISPSITSIKVIARDRLASCLLEEVREKHSDVITVRFGVECTGARWLELEGGAGATLALKKHASDDHGGGDGDGDGDTLEFLTAEFVIAADGVRSAIRDGLEEDKGVTKALSGREMRVTKFPKKNEFAYKVVAFRLDAGFRWVCCCCCIFVCTFVVCYIL